MSLTRRMLGRSCAVLLAIFVTPPFAAAVEPVRAGSESAAQAPVAAARRLIDLIHDLERRYATVGAFTSSFRQVYRSTTFRTEEVHTGELHVRPDGSMSWVYDEPQGMRVVLEGDRWTQIDPELRLVTRRQRDAEVPGPAELLSGDVDILSLFAASFSAESPTVSEHVVFELLPRELREDLEIIVAEIDPSSADLRRLEIVHPLGDRSVFEFGPPRADVEVPDELFRIDLPAGYEEIVD